MRTVTDAEDDLQLFWQAFPAEGGAARTTYMFSYADCAKQRPSLQVLSCTLSVQKLTSSLLLGSNRIQPGSISRLGALMCRGCSTDTLSCCRGTSRAR